MYSNEELERFYFKYQAEVLPPWSVHSVFLPEQQCPLQHLFKVVQGHTPQNSSNPSGSSSFRGDPRVKSVNNPNQ